MLRRTFLFLIVYLFMDISSIFAQWNGDPTQATPVCTNEETNWLLDMCSDEEGNIFVIFTNNHLLAIQMMVDGVQQWGPDGLLLSPGSESVYIAKAISDDAGGVIVVWYDYRNGENEFYAQRVSGTGTFLWGDSGLVLPTQGAIGEQFAIASDRHSGVIVAYEGNAHYNWNIYAIRISSEGLFPWGGSDVVVCSQSSNQHDASICTDDEGNAIISWYDSRNVHENIYAQRISFRGNIMWQTDGVPICNVPGDQNFSINCPDGEKGAIICWDDLQTGVRQIYAQRVDSTGAIMWDSLGTPVYTGLASAYKKQMISDEKHGAIICWEISGRIVSQRINAAGIKVWPEGGVVVYYPESGGGHDPKLTGDGESGAYYCWWGIRVASEDIYAQRVDSSGIVLWEYNGVPLCIAERGQNGCLITGDGYGGAVAAWNDNREFGDVDVYASRVLPSGDLTPITAKEEIPHTIELTQNYPNPFNPGTTISYSIPRASMVKIYIYNTLGEIITMPVHEFQTPGNYTIRVDGSKWASGVYFYRLEVEGTSKIKKMVLMK